MSTDTSSPSVVVEIVSDPQENAQRLAQRVRHDRNSRWLSKHWRDLLPAARGRFVAVANQQSFLADTAEAAWAWAAAEHPNDDGAIVRFVRTESGPRFYGNRRSLG